MLTLELDAEEPLTMPKAPLLPTLAVPVFNNRSPNMTAIPALVFDTATLPKLVALPTPNEIMMELLKALLPLAPTIVTSSLLVLPSPEARVKLPPLLVNDNP
jgi:hypothetical protein